MVAFNFASITAVFSVLVSVGHAATIPTSRRLNGTISMFNHPGLKASTNVKTVTPTSDVIVPESLVADATPAAPHFVVYSDEWVSGLTGPPAVSAVSGFNVFALSFLLTEGAFDKAEEWTQLSASQRSTIKSQYAAAGIKLIVSLFGSTDAPTSSGADPIATANTMAAWVIQFGLDGVDVDYEDFNAINAGDGKAEAWLTSFTQQLRVKLPAGQFILTHAPVAPWFSPNKFGGGAYLTVNKNVGSLIDWDSNLRIRFFCIEGTSEYTTCAGLLTASSSTWPQSSVFQIAASGVALNKIVIGKPAASGDASNGFMSTSTLASCVSQAKAKGWNAGVSTWEYPDATAPWISAVRGSTF
ncbi:glycoside hydrolase family 18 protein [Sphaerobolus stellatus SS14]|nr:glycoside hydrolase family 18 protein [Sphaerobolus stellatus SS14]